ncbi:hypothetical protein STH2213 [Symbiobacterium thermophilum IAM 14863]|uniref:Uncharacterized protein n=2 Tax=Symbiobacterium thermophilum TaxID=2734 RepID=Q67M95_SYMTH|nr:hypothetical protein STH2213 [Symbiobacterium thermophilum IAM 14863]
MLISTGQAGAEDWITKGGTPQRMSVVAEPLGLTEITVYWETKPLGESATQPAVVNGVIYHLAGPYLWRLELDQLGRPKGDATAVTDPVKAYKIEFNRPPGGPVIAPQSSPTYSPDSGVLYFGTGYGWLWAYNTREGWYRPAELDLGCPIVGSPLVIHDRGRDIVVVADRPNYPGEEDRPVGRPLCPRSHGKVWVVQGLDRPDDVVRWQNYQAPTTKQAEDGFGGYITPSAVSAPVHGLNPSFVVGADGFEGGRAIRLALDRNNDYRPYMVWAVDGPAGFAGNFTTDGTNAYWMDTRGHLWGATLHKGHEPTGWGTYSIPLPALIGAKAAFTNTEPAVEVRQTPDGPETHLYVTLRNYSDTGAGLRDGPTGSDGAVVAIGSSGELKWYRKFGPADRLDGRMASLNTAPLALVSRGALLFGDVNGFFYSYSLDNGNPSGGSARAALIHPESRTPVDRLFLLKAGERPNVGPYNFSQVSGVGVDPAFAHGLLLVGVNFETDGGTSGRLVAFRTGESYDLRWLDAPAPLELTPGTPVALEPRLQLEMTTRTLAALCPGPWTVRWFVTDADGQLVRPLGEVPLPGELGPQQPYPVPLTVTLAEGDPAEGWIVGVIDLPTVYALSTAHTSNPKVALARGMAAAQGLPAEKTCAGAVAELIERKGEPGPEGGLANNVLIVPYAIRQPAQVVVDDPSVVDLAVPSMADAGRPFEVGIYLGYQNNLGRSAIRVPLRLWARPESGGSAPAGGWQTVTIDRMPCCTLKTGTIPGLSAGTWEIVAEIDYPEDTRPENNRVIRRVEVLSSKPVEAGGPEGGAITD